MRYNKFFHTFANSYKFLAYRYKGQISRTIRRSALLSNFRIALLYNPSTFQLDAIAELSINIPTVPKQSNERNTDGSLVRKRALHLLRSAAKLSDALAFDIIPVRKRAEVRWMDWLI